VPEEWNWLDELPRTASGKVLRRMPEEWNWLDELPRTASGKVLRRML
jgi:acyl-coenzyme A synthetase/AMP-(fatty) acid ligase